MQEAHDRQAGAGRERLVHCDAIDAGAFRLSEVERDHRHRVAARGEQAREDALLDLGAAGELDARVSREHRPGERRDEANALFSGQGVSAGLRRDAHAHPLGEGHF